MARLQILELPEGASDDRPPFVLVIDQADEQTVADLREHDARAAEGTSPLQHLRSTLVLPLADQIGARAVLAFESTIDIPANDALYAPPDNQVHVRMQVEGDFEGFRQQVQEEATAAANTLAGARYAADQYSDQQPHPYGDGGHAARENGREAFARSIGMSPLSSWSDMQAESVRIRDHLANARERLSLAKDALIADGYFTADEITADIAPRITEWLAHHREESTKFRASVRDALGLDNDDAVDLPSAARSMRNADDRRRAVATAIHNLHRAAEHRGQIICAECSAYDGSTSDSPYVAHPCDTVKALDAKPEASGPEPAGD